MFNQGRNKDEHTLTLAPFCPVPKVQYDDVEKGTAARRTLHVKNPSKEDVEVSFIKYPQEDKGFTYSWIKRVIGAGNSEELEITWKPFEGGRFFENIALQFGRKFKASISLNGNCIEINRRINKIKRTPKRRFLRRTLKRKATPGNFDQSARDLNTTSTPAKTCENKNASPITTNLTKQKPRKALNLKQTTPAKKIKTFHQRTFVVNSEIRVLKAKNPYNSYINKTEGTFEKTHVQNRNKNAECGKRKFFGEKDGNSKQCAFFKQQQTLSEETYIVKKRKMPDKENIFAGDNKSGRKSLNRSYNLKAKGNNVDSHEKENVFVDKRQTLFEHRNVLNANSVTNRRDSVNSGKCTVEGIENNVTNIRDSVNSDKCTGGWNQNNATNIRDSVNSGKCAVGDNENNFANKRVSVNSGKCTAGGKGNNVTNRRDSVNSDKCTVERNGNNAANKTVLVNREKCTAMENQRNFVNKKTVVNSEHFAAVASENNVTNIKPAGICTVINTTINKNDAFNIDNFTSVEIQNRKDAFNMDKCTADEFKNNVANKAVSINSDNCIVGWSGNNVANKTVLVNREKCTEIENQRNFVNKKDVGNSERLATAGKQNNVANKTMLINSQKCTVMENHRNVDNKKAIGNSEKCTIIENQRNFGNKKDVGNSEHLALVANRNNVANIKQAGICTVINTFNIDKFTPVEIPNRKDAFNVEKCTAEEFKNNAANEKDGVISEGRQAVENENNAANKKDEVNSERRKAEESKNIAANEKDEVNGEGCQAMENENNAGNKKDEVNSEKCKAAAFKDNVANENGEVNKEQRKTEAADKTGSENCKSVENQTNVANKTDEALENKNENFDMEKLNMSSDKITFKRYRDETDEDLFESLDSSNDEFFNSTQRKSETFSEISVKNEARSDEKRKNAGLNFKEWKNISEIVAEEKLRGKGKEMGDLRVNRTDDEKESAKASLNGEEMRIVPKGTCERLNTGRQSAENVAIKTNVIEKSLGRKVKLPVNDLHDPDEFLKAISAKSCGVKYNWTLAEEAALKERVNCLLAPQIAKTKTNAIDKLMSKRKTQQDSEAEKLRDKATELFRSQEVFKVVSKIISIADAGKISIAQDKNVHNNVNMQQHIITLLLNYNPVWLRVGLETVFEEALALKAKADISAITEFAMSKFFKNAHIARKLKSAVSPKYLHEIKKHVLRKFLMLVYFLDSAKSRKILPHDPCLFRRNSGLKDSKAILLAFTTKYLTPVRDIVKLLQAIGLQLTHKQTYLHEFNYAYEHVEADFKDGLRLTKLLDAILLTDSLPSLRAPAISRLQKLHNVKLAFDLLAKARCVLPEDITVKDIVGGDRVKTLSLLTCALRLAEKGCDVAGAT